MRNRNSREITGHGGSYKMTTQNNESATSLLRGPFSLSRVYIVSFRNKDCLSKLNNKNSDFTVGNKMKLYY